MLTALGGLAGYVSPMSESPRNKANILVICEASLADVESKLKQAKKAIKEAEVQIEAVKSRQVADLAAANLELSKNATLIQDVEREGLPAAKLHEKAKDIRARIEKMQSDHAQSKELAAAQDALVRAEAETKRFEELRQAYKLQVEMANELKNSFEISKGEAGACEAPEYETLEEAVSEYIANMPILVGVSKDLVIDRVAMWQVPNDDDPICSKLMATEGKAYRLNQMPDSLTWLKDFLRSPYSKMTSGSQECFQSEGVAFQMAGDVLADADEEGPQEKGEANETGDANGSKESAWIKHGMDEYFKDSGHGHYGSRVIDRPAPSLFAPSGIGSSYDRSGLCFVKSEGRFYTLFPRQFVAAKMVPGKVKYVQNGYWYERDGQVASHYEIDASLIFEDLLVAVHEATEALLPEFKELQSAKSPLVVRVAKAVQAVGVLETTFEQQTKRLTGAEVTAEVGAYWDAFVNAPWEGSVTGDLAMLKHLCERKLESPHVWSYSIKGHYGLRVRTRDHDWITARIYCPPADFSPKNPVPHDEVVYYRNGDYGCNAHVRVGPCYIKVLGRQK
jgi:hypothetical protein